MITTTQITMESTYKLLRHGKVRDLYDIGHNMLLIRHSDRISSFDKIWCDIQNKGIILNSISVWWFQRTKHIIDNHLIYVPKNGRDMIVKNCSIFPIEFVVRGYITGNTSTSLWTHYNNEERTYCGITFPDGLKKNQKLTTAVITPTTKGDHDDPISAEEIIQKGIMTQEDWDICSNAALELFKYGQLLAKGAGLILVDTKYEFGVDYKGNILLVDEIHTCDSSRYWKYDTYSARFGSGMEPERFDKDLIRTFITTQCDPYDTKPSDVTIPLNLKESIKTAYQDFYKMLTDKNIQNNTNNTNIEHIVEQYYDKYHKNRVNIISSDKGDEWKDTMHLQSKFKEKKIYVEVAGYNIYKGTKLFLSYIQTLHKKQKKNNLNPIYITLDPTIAMLLSGNILFSTVILYISEHSQLKTTDVNNIKMSLQNYPIIISTNIQGLIKYIDNQFIIF